MSFDLRDRGAGGGFYDDGGAFGSSVEGTSSYSARLPGIVIRIAVRRVDHVIAESGTLNKSRVDTARHAVCCRTLHPLLYFRARGHQSPHFGSYPAYLSI